MANKTTFWSFLKNNYIEISIIQRDYAQGRLGKENLRKNFLGDLKRALDKEPPYKDTEMKLDFIYGTTENDRLNPLDGQQRLTTLWLLHWYIALRADMLNEDNCAILKKFTYETRITSREFCRNLCIPKNFENFCSSDIVGFITKQTWFYSAWKQDPTIQSMLRMLSGTKISDKKGEDITDGIDELFDDDKCVDTFVAYWNILTDDTLCPIVFYNLPLHDFGLTDDLYIKMNARGKQLTSFENFKADLIGYMTKCSEEAFEDKQKSQWELLLDTRKGLPIKFDTDWTDIFWANRSCGIKEKNGKGIKSKSNHIDEIFFAFLNRFFWNELFIARKSDNPSQFLLDMGKGDENSVQENENASYRYLNDSANRNPNDYDTKIAYQGLDEYKYDNGVIPIEFFLKLQRVLNNYYRFSQNCTLPTCPWDSSFRFIPQYVKDENSDNIEISNNANEKILKVSTLNQVQRIVFFAICKYFDHDDTVEDSMDSMKKWIRVIWNLISGEGEDGRPQIRSSVAMRTAIEHIEKLDAHDVYNSLNCMPFDEKTSDFNERTVYILATTSLLDFVITHIPSSWIRNYHNHIAIFPSGKGIFLNAEKRDGLLSSTEQIGIREEHIVPETTLLYGSDINFTFNNHNFQWYRNDFVYIMDEYWNYAIKDEKAQEEMDKYYCRSTRDVQDSTGLIQMLTEFINIYSNKLL